MTPTAESTIPGTSIKESAMERMLRHNREITGNVPEAGDTIDHAKIAEGLQRSQPVLLPGVGSSAPAPRIRVSRQVERIVEGVQGTSPTPGQDAIAYVPPTTSQVTDPGNSGKGPDAENQPATKGPKSRSEQMMADLSTLFGESGNPFAKEGDGDDDDEDENKDKDGKDKDKDDDKDGKGKKDGEEGDDDEGVDEAVEVRCESCGYEETYDLSEASIAEGSVPLTPDGKLDNKCPMCGADMDLSMIGATNTGAVTDPNPFTDAQGHTGPQESVSQESLAYAGSLVGRILQGESVDTVAKSVIESDFLERKSKKRQPAMAGSC